ncbi:MULTISPECIES: hypothetical protein [Kytococcus]|uniref:hypothetical protein n=1 Tax=Kytococcus TaxID=57499 RepID=UPI0008A325DE|nr:MULTISPECIES: hypothetical protein [Kytococcus]OFS11630.1 hypothetical protein HMPREF3099_07835 [Kytococcus sp. HMSC28H12]
MTTEPQPTPPDAGLPTRPAVTTTQTARPAEQGSEGTVAPSFIVLGDDAASTCDADGVCR